MSGANLQAWFMTQVLNGVFLSFKPEQLQTVSYNNQSLSHYDLQLKDTESLKKFVQEMFPDQVKPFICFHSM